MRMVSDCKQWHVAAGPKNTHAATSRNRYDNLDAREYPLYLGVFMVWSNDIAVGKVVRYIPITLDWCMHHILTGDSPECLSPHLINTTEVGIPRPSTCFLRGRVARPLSREFVHA